ncbi:MAG: aminoglycoside phosphotransferase, partial [Gammaproteobacteria bacterium]
MTTAEPNAERRGWLGTHLEHAAGVLGVTTTGTPVFGWHDRTIGTRVSTADGEHWLRVVAEMSHWASGAFWTGNHDARAISGVPKPQLRTELDWSDGDCQLRAELMTLASSPVIATDMVLRAVPDLAPTWWADLRRAVDTLAAHPTARACV